MPVCAGKVAKAIRPEEYIHDYLLEDTSLKLKIRRLTWKTPLHFENEVYISLHYGQVRASVGTCHASPRGLLHSMCLEQNLGFTYTTKTSL